MSWDSRDRHTPLLSHESQYIHILMCLRERLSILISSIALEPERRPCTSVSKWRWSSSLFQKVEMGTPLTLSLEKAEMVSMHGFPRISCSFLQVGRWDSGLWSEGWCAARDWLNHHKGHHDRRSSLGINRCPWTTYGFPLISIRTSW